MKKKKLIVEVNGIVIDTSKYKFLLKNRNTNDRTIVNQENPLLDRAAKIIARM